MKNTDLFNGIGEISDELITEAGNAKRIRAVPPSRVALIAAALTAALGFTAFAAVRGALRSEHMSNVPDYYSVPSDKTLEDDIGFSPNIPDVFSNGYKFDSGHISYNEDTDQDGNAVERFNGILCKYSFDGGKLYINADNASSGVGMSDSETVETYKGSPIKYFAYTNKRVPPDYELTEQDKADEASGALVFSYGSAEVTISRVQLAGFEYGGINYTINVMDSPLTKADLIKIAEEIIDYKK